MDTLSSVAVLFTTTLRHSTDSVDAFFVSAAPIVALRTPATAGNGTVMPLSRKTLHSIPREPDSSSWTPVIGTSASHSTPKTVYGTALFGWMDTSSLVWTNDIVLLTITSFRRDDMLD